MSLLKTLGGIGFGLLGMLGALVQIVILNSDSGAPIRESFAAMCADIARFGGHTWMATVGYFIPLIGAAMCFGAMVVLTRSDEARRSPLPLSRATEPIRRPRKF
jgi:hypothetical protein